MYPDEINPMDTFWSPISAGIPAFPVIFWPSLVYYL